MICTRCENIEIKKELNVRQKINAIFLILLFFPLGILYLFYLKNKVNKCSECGGSLIEESSPKGRKILGGKDGK